MPDLCRHILPQKAWSLRVGDISHIMKPEIKFKRNKPTCAIESCEDGMRDTADQIVIFIYQYYEPYLLWSSNLVASMFSPI